MTGADDQISEDARMLAERVRVRAAGMPTPDDIAGLAADALTSHGSTMTPAQIRELAAEVLAKAQQASYLLGKLAGYLEDRPGAT